MTISEEDFDIINDQEVRHRQTGATWATYRYESADDAGSSVTMNPGRAGEGHFPTAAELLPYAVALLRRLAKDARPGGAPSPKGWT